MAVPVYGLDKELQAKKDAKYDVNLENEVAEWIEAVTGSAVKGNFVGALKSGEVLCNLANRIRPGSIAKVNKGGMPFKERDNLSNFIKACTDFGVRGQEIFNVGDLYEEKHIGGVVLCICRLGSVVQTNVPSFGGPHLGQPDYSKSKAEASKGPVIATEQTGAALITPGANAAGGNGSAQRRVPRVAAGLKSAALETSGRSGVAEPNPAVTLPLKQAGRGTAPAPLAAKATQEVESPAVRTYGLDKELAEKAAAKYDQGLEDEAAVWIEAITKAQVRGNFAAALRSGEVLCQLANAIKPGVVPKINKGGMPFKERENLSNFIKACGEFGVRSHDIFNVGDLYEEKNLGSVVSSMYSLGGSVQRIAPNLPKLGVADKSRARVEVAKGLQMKNQMGVAMS